LAPYITRPEPPPPLPGPTAPHSPSSETRTKLIGIRQRIAANMVASKQHIPHYSYVDECDVTDLVRLRDQLKEPLQNQGVKLTYLPFIIKAVARALGEMPALNSTFDDTTQEIITHPTVNIGVAVAAPAGLMVPVLKRADQKDIVTIAKDIDRLATDARNGRIKPDDIQGGTFTVTSIGGIGGLISTPIIHRPQVAILGIGKIVKRPVYDDAGQLRPAEMLYLSFSFDHRIIDGAIGAQFGNAVIRQLSQPAALLLG
jgi:pyruvate dehydrogenase E2 component (dihydrolipoamide acetyltransferase)/2-oxoisovalerate dehydrogenase E2 component (dihydrolipoyl transacylase)